MANLYDLIVPSAAKSISLSSSSSLEQLALAFPDMFGSRTDGVSTVEASFTRVPWIFRAVSLSANTVMSVPYLVYKGTSKEPTDWPFENTSEEWFHWRSDAAQNLWGAAFWLIDWPAKALFWLNPITMKVVTDSRRGIIRFIQEIDGSVVGNWPPEAVLYLPRFHPTQDFGPGIAPAAVAMRNAGLSYNVTSYAAEYFAHGAIPAVLLKSEAPLRPQEQERIASVWQNLYGGIQNAWRTAVLGRGIEPVVIGHTIKDLAMPELTDQATMEIAAAFEMSVTFLRGEAANYATDVEESTKYWVGTVSPKCLLRQSQMNLQLWKPVMMRGAYDLKSVEQIQQYEALKAESLSKILSQVDAGFTNKILTRDRSVYLYEQIFSSMGYEEMVAIPDEEPEPEPAPVIVQNQPFGGGNGSQPAAEEKAAPQPLKDVLPVSDTTTELTIADLRIWRRFIKKRGLAGALGRTFESHHIPVETIKRVTAYLHAAPDLLSALQLFDDLILHMEGKSPDPLEALEDVAVIVPAPDSPIDVDALLEPAIRAWDEVMPAEASGILDAEPV